MDAFLGLPQITKFWCIGIVVTTLAVEFKTIPGMKLMFTPERAFTTQPWRLITSFWYYGEVLIPIVLTMISNIRWSKLLEESYTVPMSLFPDDINNFNRHQHHLFQQALQRFKPLDYWYYLLMISVSIMAMVSWGHYYLNYTIPMLGFILHEVLTYIYVKRNPDVQVAIFGLITVRGMQIPLITYMFDWVMTENFQNQIHQLLTGNIGIIPDILTSPVAWKSFVCLFLGHFWWFVYDIILQSFYLDQNEPRRLSRVENKFRKRQMNEFNLVDYTRKMVQWVLLPPWYWFVIYSINRGRFHLD